MMDIHIGFQELMTYCADDCVATHEVFAASFAKFLTMCPHPITLAGMFEMGTACVSSAPPLFLVPFLHWQHPFFIPCVSHQVNRCCLAAVRATFPTIWEAAPFTTKYSALLTQKRTGCA
jgi:hypothetical protein